jgi:tRNA-specific 2-thiouridylase
LIPQKWAVPKDVISRTIFPIGTYEKTNVRKLAAKLKLPVAAKRDSQGICFLGSVSVDEFLRQELKTKPGIAVSSNGREVGMHDGAVLYTIGERIALQNSTQGPWYVTQKDMNTNILIVSHEHSLPINSSEVALRETNWFENIDALEIVEAQYRYHGPLVQGTIDQRTGIFTPTKSFPEPFAKGQSLVIYIKEKCIGGGIIS